MNTDIITLNNFINGDFVAPKSNNYFDVFEPATGLPFAKVADSNQDDVNAAVHAARTAAHAWANTPTTERAHLLNRLADLMESHLEEFAEAESIDSGKTMMMTRSVDVPRSISNLRFFAAATTQFASESHAMESRAINYTLRQPLGVVVCISPWNYPLHLFTWKIAPALAAGNTVIAKPSEVTPYTATLFGRLCIDAGLPKGVLNILHGNGVNCGAPLTAHPEVKAISFTGSTASGKSIAQVAAGNLKKFSLELGGKNATIIFADAEWEKNLETLIRSAFGNQGQICLCGSRILVERPIYNAFRDSFVARAKKLRVGDPNAPDTDLGPVVSKVHRDKIIAYIELAKTEGGKILCGGGKQWLSGRCQDGWFIAPTVIDGLGPSCRTNQEEIFGPVVSLQAFDREDEAVAIANCTPYGLSASVWTRELARAHRVSANLQAGIVWINSWNLRDLRTPFGGVKQSGMGREGGWESMRFFTEAKNICVNLE